MAHNMHRSPLAINVVFSDIDCNPRIDSRPGPGLIMNFKWEIYPTGERRWFFHIKMKNMNVTEQ
jgi:hypothetical protein